MYNSYPPHSLLYSKVFDMIILSFQLLILITVEGFKSLIDNAIVVGLLNEHAFIGLDTPIFYLYFVDNTLLFFDPIASSPYALKHFFLIFQCNFWSSYQLF